jgi:hypothetical protein
MKKINLVKTIAVLGMLTFASCQKEKMDLREESSLQSYPDEITLDNWEQFVHAPQSVIDYHINKELAKNEKKSNKKSTESFSPESLVGEVIAFDGTWNGIEDVQVTIGGSSIMTNIFGNYIIANSSIGSLCMNYATLPTNGVSSLDILLIQRHILHIVPFTEARQFIAADVTNDGKINIGDMIRVRELILGKISMFPSGNNVLFIPEVYYASAQNQINSSGNLVQSTLNTLTNLSSCQSVNYRNRRAIKMGDVNGSFVF